MKQFNRPVLIIGVLLWAVGLRSGDVAAHDESAANTGSRTAAPYNAVSRGTRNLVLGTVTIKMLLDESNLGRSDIEVGELNLPAEYVESVAHVHTSLEIFYVVEGILGHEVNGKMYSLQPGEVGFLHPGDQIRHSVLSDRPVKAVVIWLPGGEADALINHAGFKSEPVE